MVRFALQINASCGKGNVSELALKIAHGKALIEDPTCIAMPQEVSRYPLPLSLLACRREPGLLETGGKGDLIKDMAYFPRAEMPGLVAGKEEAVVYVQDGKGGKD